VARGDDMQTSNEDKVLVVTQRASNWEVWTFRHVAAFSKQPGKANLIEIMTPRLNKFIQCH